MVAVRPVRAGDRAFVALPYRLHRDDPNWVPPLRMEVRKQLDPKRNPFFKHADTQLFLAERDGLAVGRISAHIDFRHNERHGDTGMFGFFEATDQETADALVAAAEDWLRERGMPNIQGPYSWSMHETVGNLVEGFHRPPALMMGHNPPSYDAYLTGAGLAKVKDLFTFKFTVEGFPPEQKAMYEELKEGTPIKLRRVDLKRFEDELRIVFDIYNAAWADNWGFVPIAEDELATIAKDLKTIIDPTLALIAEIDGEPVGMAIAVPDVNELIGDLNGRLFPLGLPKLLWRLKVRGVRNGRLMLLGIKPEHRGPFSMAILLNLYGKLVEDGSAKGLTGGELGWTLEDNHSINESIKMTGAVQDKTYRIYRKAL